MSDSTRDFKIYCLIESPSNSLGQAFLSPVLEKATEVRGLSDFFKESELTQSQDLGFRVQGPKPM